MNSSNTNDLLKSPPPDTVNMNLGVKFPAFQDEGTYLTPSHSSQALGILLTL